MTNISKPVSRIAVNGTRFVLRTGERDKRRNAGSVPQGASAVLGRVEDEDVAARSGAMLLITAPTRSQVETLARRIHRASAHNAAPFLSVRAGTLPIEPRAIREQCSTLLDAAAGGSLLMTAVEEMPLLVQGVFLDWLTDRGGALTTSGTSRFIAGTTVSLLARVTAGAFSERLFYRLNAIHLVVRSNAA